MSARFLSFCIDIFTIGFLKFAFLVAYGLGIQALNMDAAAAAQAAAQLDMILGTVMFIAYFSMSYGFFSGKTFGMYVMGIDLAGTDEWVPFQAGLLRTLGHLSYYIGLGLPALVPFFRKDRKSIADLLSGTTCKRNVDAKREWLLGQERIELTDPNELLDSHSTEDQEKKSA